MKLQQKLIQDPISMQKGVMSRQHLVNSNQDIYKMVETPNFEPPKFDNKFDNKFEISSDQSNNHAIPVEEKRS